MKIGNPVVIHFSCFGLTSKETWTISRFDDSSVTLENDCDEYVFDRKTGKCLNDNGTFGARRTIDPQ